MHVPNSPHSFYIYESFENCIHLQNTKTNPYGQRKVNGCRNIFTWNIMFLAVNEAESTKTYVLPLCIAAIQNENCFCLQFYFTYKHKHIYMHRVILVKSHQICVYVFFSRVISLCRIAIPLVFHHQAWLSRSVLMICSQFSVLC